jgi:hypothetical protein
MGQGFWRSFPFLSQQLPVCSSTSLSIVWSFDAEERYSSSITAGFFLKPLV